MSQCEVCCKPLLPSPTQRGHRKRKYCSKACGMTFYRMKRYGLRPEEWRDLRKQGCAICRSTTGLVMDHDHVSGKFRGILCSACNTMLGNVWENMTIWGRAVLYLQRKETHLACEICQRNDRVLKIDHHTEQPGILCLPCTVLLSQARNNPDFIEQALTYITQAQNRLLLAVPFDS